MNIDERLKRFFAESLGIIRQYMLISLQKLGEECVARIRDRSAEESWIDHTGNLRSSIGYAVYDYGVKYMQSSFSTVLGGVEGSSTGAKMVADLASEFTNVYALVVVAGMNYADYVEAIETKDVLESTKQWAMSIVTERLNRAKEEAIKKINTIQL